MTMTALKAMIRMGRPGQAAVEYILTTMVLVTCFAAMYGFIQSQLKTLFILAGKKILATYY
jgi:hypothetical protein